MRTMSFMLTSDRPTIKMTLLPSVTIVSGTRLMTVVRRSGECSFGFLLRTVRYLVAYDG